MLIAFIKELLPNILISLLIAILLTACSIRQQSSGLAEEALNSKQLAYYNNAVSAMKSGKTKRAIALFTKLTNQQPNHSNSHVNLGILYLQNKYTDKAKQSFETALKINAENIYALNQLALIKRQDGEFSQAKVFYEKAIDISPDYAYAHLNLGILYDLYLYDYPNAIKHYEIYQKLTKNKDTLVKKWIVEISRRHKKQSS